MKFEDRAYEELAKKHALSEKQISDVCRSVFGLVAETIASGKCQAVRVPYAGIFMCRPRRVEKLGLNNLNNNDREHK